MYRILTLFILVNNALSQNFKFEFGLNDQNAFESPRQTTFPLTPRQTAARQTLSSRDSRADTIRVGSNTQTERSTGFSSFVFSGVDTQQQSSRREQPSPRREQQSPRREQQPLQPERPTPTRREQPSPRREQPTSSRREQLTTRREQSTSPRRELLMSRREQATPSRREQPVRIQRPQAVRQNTRQIISPQENEISLTSIGRSPCARGLAGHSCRMQLKITALRCTSESGRGHSN